MLVNIYIYWYKYIYVFFSIQLSHPCVWELKIQELKKDAWRSTLSLSPRLEILAKIIFCSIDFLMALYNSATQL